MLKNIPHFICHTSYLLQSPLLTTKAENIWICDTCISWTSNIKARCCDSLHCCTMQCHETVYIEQLRHLLILCTAPIFYLETDQHMKAVTSATPWNQPSCTIEIIKLDQYFAIIVRPFTKEQTEELKEGDKKRNVVYEQCVNKMLDTNFKHRYKLYHQTVFIPYLLPSYLHQLGKKWE